MKKVLSLILAFVFVVGVFVSAPITANAASVSDLTFELNEEGTMYQVKDCNESASGDLVIPSTYNGLPVTKIGSSAFYWCDSLTSVTIPDSVTIIGSRAFYWCMSLTNVTIPDSVTIIGGSAFYCCDSLTNVTIPDSVTSIGEYAFYDCTSLTSVNITNLASWCNISFGGFAANPLYYAGNLYLNGKLVTDLVIPDSVTSIGWYAFDGCKSLTNVTIPDSVTSIGNGTFEYCASLTNVTIPDSVTSIGASAFACCTSLTNVTIPDSITSISSWGFGYKYDSWEEKEEKIPGFTIYGAKNSKAERYATENGFTFIETEETKPHKHTYTSTITKQPSYTETGLKTFTCSCGDSYTEVIPKLEKFSAPAILSVTSEAKGVKFTWDEVPGVTGYIVYKLVDGAYQQVAVQAPSNRVYVDQKAENGKTYSYIVASMDNIGNPCGKSEFTHTYKKLVSLATPTVTSANATNGIKVTWNAIENAETYTIYRRVYNESTKKYSGWSAIKTGYTGTNFTDTNVKFGIIYSYTVRAVNGDVKSNYKAATGTRVNTTPTVKVANASNGVKVTWNAVPNATGYTVYSASYNAKTKKWSGWTNRGTVKSGTTSWTDKNTKSGTYYKYTVRACYGSFKSSYKASDKIWYLAQPTVTVKAVSNGVNVNWTQSSGSASYIIYRQEYNAKTKTWSGWKNMGSLGKDKKSWTDKSAKKGVYYKYTVRAVNGNYKSTYKASASVKR